ncbi:hypothetical protein AYK26_05865 [Euryarchaeota archaeon SM23-78]|nr:MAG: hypothetical protein AYK26_05865 [Euryarchaeota archaeon SM23-78]MBW3001014.1 hypothetical protein [Candidatus Woesearchaeota archaeon]
MAQKTKDRFSVSDEKIKKLDELRKTRRGFSGDIYQGLKGAEEIFKKLENATAEQVSEQLSKLDQGIEKYGTYKITIADLAAGLTDGLDEFVDFAEKSKSYQGFEKVLKWVYPKEANRRRVNRIRNQNPKENLEHILHYANLLVEEILSIREVAEKTYSGLEVNTTLLVEKINEYQPREQAYKEKLDIMEAEYKKKEEECKTADPAEQARLEKEKDVMHEQLLEVRLEYDKVLTMYNQAQQALEASKQSRNAFEQMVRDLGRQAVMIKEKVDNITEIYMAAPEAIKVMMTTKGMEKIDQSINVATDKSVDMIILSSEGVRESTQAREKIQLIDEKIMRGYIDRLNNMFAEFNKGMDEIRKQARRSQEERYTLPKEH